QVAGTVAAHPATTVVRLAQHLGACRLGTAIVGAELSGGSWGLTGPVVCGGRKWPARGGRSAGWGAEREGNAGVAWRGVEAFARAGPAITATAASKGLSPGARPLPSPGWKPAGCPGR